MDRQSQDRRFRERSKAGSRNRPRTSLRARRARAGGVVPNELPHPRVIPHWPWQRTVIVLVFTIASIGLLLIAVEHKESQFAGTADCPSVATINGVLLTTVTGPSAVSEEDLLGCFYPQGSDDQAVSVSFAVPTRSSDPCQKRP